jgi:hypothetical protein
MQKPDRKRVVVDQQLDLVSAILTVIIAGATAFAGINVMSSISASMSLASGDAFYEPMQDLQDGVGTFFQQLPTVFIFLALVLIIGYLTILRR